MKKRMIRVLCLIATAALLFTGCTATVSSDDSAGTDEAVRQTNAAAQNQDRNAAMVSTLDQLVEQGDMTEAEKQEFLTYIEEQAGSEGPIRKAVNEGVISQQQAQALGQLLGGLGPPDGMQGREGGQGSSGPPDGVQGHTGYGRSAGNDRCDQRRYRMGNTCSEFL